MRAEQRGLPARPVCEDGYKSLQYVRYADDFIIGVIGSKKDAESIKCDLAAFLNDGLRLTLSREKTTVTHSAENARFLGYDISVSRSQDIKRKKDGSRQRVYSGVVKLHMPREKWAAKLLELGAIRIKKDKATDKEHWQATHRGKLINLNDIDILSRVNSEVRGYYNYYSIACNAATLNHFSSLMKYSMLKTFGAKYRCQVQKVKERYVKNGAFTVAYETKGSAKEATYYNKGFRQKKAPSFGQVDVLDSYKQYVKPNSLTVKLRTKTCELCGEKADSIEIHQVKRLKDLKGQSEWEVEMRRRRRKTLAVCHRCHERIHSKVTKS
jgi:hypothetical protein